MVTTSAMCRRPTDGARARLGLAAAIVSIAPALARAEPAIPRAEPAPLAAASIAVDDAATGGAMLARLAGHRARLIAGRLVIDDVAGEGRPWVGVIERRGDGLWLVTDGGAVRLAGPLARPRVAGPGYRAWATGALAGDAPPTLLVRRLGILARPAARAAPRR
jgi:hypothetical protein